MARNHASEASGEMAGRGTAMSELLAALPEKRVIGEPPRSVSSIASDSRRVEPGGCFVAVPGFKQDGRHFIPDAVRRGAAEASDQSGPRARGSGRRECL